MTRHKKKVKQFAKNKWNNPLPIKEKLAINPKPTLPPNEKETIPATESQISTKQKKNKKDLSIYIQENNSPVNSAVVQSTTNNIPILAKGTTPLPLVLQANGNVTLLQTTAVL